MRHASIYLSVQTGTSKQVQLAHRLISHEALRHAHRRPRRVLRAGMHHRKSRGWPSLAGPGIPEQSNCPEGVCCSARLCFRMLGSQPPINNPTHGTTTGLPCARPRRQARGVAPDAPRHGGGWPCLRDPPRGAEGGRHRRRYDTHAHTDSSWMGRTCMYKLVNVLDNQY